jgi:putative endonuclease
MYSIYILFSLKTNRYYIGSTDDLQGRLKHHNAGSTPPTKSGAPNWDIRYTKTVPDRIAALKRELEIKKKKSKNYIEGKFQKGKMSLNLEESSINQFQSKNLPYTKL